MGSKEVEATAEIRLKHKGVRIETERFKHVDPLLLSVSAGLGSLKEDENGEAVYVAEPDCLDCLKDLQRFLRKDNQDTRDTFFQLCEYDTARNDLVPILLRYADNHDLVYNGIKVLTFLTMPIQPTSARPSSQLANLQHIKEVIVGQPDVLAVICGEAAEALSRHPRMNEEQTATAQVCLSLLRNLLAIPDRLGPGMGGLASMGVTANGVSANLHARFLSAMLDADALDLITAVCKLAQERPFKSEIALLLDLVHEVVKGLDMQLIANAQEPKPQPPKSSQETQAKSAQAATAQQPAAAAAQRPPMAAANAGAKAGAAAPQPAQKDKKVAAQMQAILAAEKAQRASILRGGPRLHSRDTGRFVRKHIEHSSAVMLTSGPKASELPAMVMPPPVLDPNDASQAQNVTCDFTDPSLIWRLRQWLTEYSKSGAYNVLIEVARRDAEAGLGISRLDAQDMCRYMRVSGAFCAFARHTHARLVREYERKHNTPASDANKDTDKDTTQPKEELQSAFAGVSASLGWSTFHLTLTTWLGQVDVPDKSDLKQWELLYCCVRLLRELLAVLEVAAVSPNEHDAQAGDKLQRMLFQNDLKESGVLPVLSKCAKTFKPKKQAHSYAEDIIVSLDTAVRILERLTKADAGGFVVKRKAHAGGGGGRKAKAPSEDREDREDGDEGADKPEGEGDAPTTQAAEGEGEAQATADNTTSPDKDKEPGEGGSQGTQEAGGRGAGAGGDRRDPMELLEEEDEEDEYTRRERVKEVQLDLNKRLIQEFGHAAMVHFLVMQGLAHYASQTQEVNKAVASLLWRMAAPSPEGLGLEPLLYQLSVLRVMHKMLSDRVVRDKRRLKDVQDLLVLATRVTRNLFTKLCPPFATEKDVIDKVLGRDVADTAADAGDGDAAAPPPRSEDEQRAIDHAIEKENKIRRGVSSMVFVDLMFWKAPKVAFEISDDYLLRLDMDYEPATKNNKRTGRGGAAGAADLGPDNSDQEAEGPLRGDHDAANKDGSDGEGEAAGPAEGATRPAGDAAGAPGAAAPVRDLAAELEKRRKLHKKKQQAAARGAGDAGARGEVLGLSVEARIELMSEFERVNANKSNMDLLIGRLSGDDWTKHKVSRCLKGLGLKFGKPTEKQADELRLLWEHHGGAGLSRTELQDVLLRIGSEMEGGWTSRQIRTLLKKEGLIRTSTRGKKGGDDSGIDDGSDEGQGGASDSDSSSDSDNSDGGEGGKKTRKKKARGDDGNSDASRSEGEGLDADSIAEQYGDELRAGFRRHKEEPTEDMLVLIAAEIGQGLTSNRVRQALASLGLIKNRRRKSTGANTQPTPADDPTHTNTDAADADGDAAGSDDAPTGRKKKSDKGQRNKEKKKSEKKGDKKSEKGRKGGGGGGRRKSKGGASQEDVEALREAYEQCKDKPDMLEQLSLSQGASLKDVSVALVREGLVTDRAALRRAYKTAKEKSTLAELYTRHQAADNYLDLIAQDMGEEEGEVTTKRVLRLLRKHNLLQGEHLTAAQQEGDGDGEGDQDMLSPTPSPVDKDTQETSPGSSGGKDRRTKSTKPRRRKDTSQPSPDTLDTPHTHSHDNNQHNNSDPDTEPPSTSSESESEGGRARKAKGQKGKGGKKASKAAAAGVTAAASDASDSDSEAKAQKGKGGKGGKKASKASAAGTTKSKKSSKGKGGGKARAAQESDDDNPAASLPAFSSSSESEGDEDTHRPAKGAKTNKGTKKSAQSTKGRKKKDARAKEDTADDRDAEVPAHTPHPAAAARDDDDHAAAGPSQPSGAKTMERAVRQPGTSKPSGKAKIEARRAALEALAAKRKGAATGGAAAAPAGGAGGGLFKSPEPAPSAARVSKESRRAAEDADGAAGGAGAGESRAGETKRRRLQRVEEQRGEAAAAAAAGVAAAAAVAADTAAAAAGLEDLEDF